MPNYVDRMKARQEEIENLLDQCDGECERCAYAEPVRPSQPNNDDWYYRCTLTEDND